MQFAGIALSDEAITCIEWSTPVLCARVAAVPCLSLLAPHDCSASLGLAVLGFQLVC